MWSEKKRQTKMKKHEHGAGHANTETMPERAEVSCKLYLGEYGVGPACECDRLRKGSLYPSPPTLSALGIQPIDT
jgi:hypothetical protein